MEKLRNQLIAEFQKAMEHEAEYDESIKDPAKFMADYINMVLPVLKKAAKYEITGLGAPSIPISNANNKPSAKLLHLVVGSPPSFYEADYSTGGKSDYVNFRYVLDNYDFESTLKSISGCVVLYGKEKKRLADKHKRSKSTINKYKSKEQELLKIVASAQEHDS